jgi:hypothetical protein
VDVVDVPHDSAGLPREGFRLQPLKEVCLFQSAMHVRHAGFDELPKLELMAALGV